MVSQPSEELSDRTSSAPQPNHSNGAHPIQMQRQSASVTRHLASLVQWHLTSNPENDSSCFCFVQIINVWVNLWLFGRQPGSCGSLPDDSNILLLTDLEQWEEQRFGEGNILLGNLNIGSIKRCLCYVCHSKKSCGFKSEGSW